MVEIYILVESLNIKMEFENMSKVLNKVVLVCVNLVLK